MEFKIKEWYNKLKCYINNLTPRQKRNIIVMVVLGFILANSMLNDNVSEWISALPKKIYQFFIPYGKIKWIDEFLINHIRKFAHFIEYFILGIIISKYYYFKKKSINRLINSIFLVLSIAFLDETIQIISGRNALVSDMWIDLTGGVVGVFVYLFYRFYKYNKNNKQAGERNDNN